MSVEAVLLVVFLAALLLVVLQLGRRPGSSPARALLLITLYSSPFAIAAVLFHAEPWFGWLCGLFLAGAVGRLVVYPILVRGAKAAQSTCRRILGRRR